MIQEHKEKLQAIMVKAWTFANDKDVRILDVLHFIRDEIKKIEDNDKSSSSGNRIKNYL